MDDPKTTSRSPFDGPEDPVKWRLVVVTVAVLASLFATSIMLGQHRTYLHCADATVTECKIVR